ncbi:polysaccharide lyase 8 family protein [Streptomyces sp. A7024]|uniref:Polysaccharide lyase 8 family protein n=1 Tax=Streptomyces coryli TaxID=1128680 RepID=A0A6G4U5J6_9ACTN|nr:polysaccharide lyase 8 family protein [Streptomyces coryli]NGN66658.1 polysaccharide lyase 8 family protein [Streptomyces coryli]
MTVRNARLPRRGFLALAGSSALLAGLPPWMARADAGALAASADFAAARGTLREILTGGAPDLTDALVQKAIAALDTSADALLARIDRRADRDRVFTDLPLDAATMRTTYELLRDLGLAYATPGTARHGDASLAADIVAGLRLTHDRIYHAGGERPGNWWFWVIGGPRALLWAASLVGEALPAADLADYSAAVKFYVPDPGTLDPVEWVGSNGSDVCEISILDGILTDDAGRITRGVQALAPILPLVTKSDGFYADGSYIGHSIFAYTGSYGLAQLGGLARLFALLADTPWAIAHPAREQFFGTVDTSFAPVIHNGALMDAVRGRAISVQSLDDRVAGYQAMEHILRLAQGVDDRTAVRWRALVKGWVTRDSGPELLPSAPLSRLALFQQTLKDDAVAPAPHRPEHRQFAVMARTVHRRPEWTYAISMAGRRIGYYEQINDQNKRGWHTGAGMTYLYDDDATQFSDAFWPTVDAYRLPGTTTDTTPLAVGAGERTVPNTSWVGGVTSPGGTYGMTGMAIRGITAAGATQVQARKAWFCLDQQVIALGAAITGGGTDGHPVVTTIENRNLHASGTHRLTVDGIAQPSTLGWTGEFQKARWAHLEGVGGYVFPGGATVHAEREARTDSWSSIDTGSAGGTTEKFTRRYATLWFDHGVEPENATYAYALLPGASAQRTAQAAAAPQAEIVANSPTTQAIRLLNRDVTMAGFFAPGSAAGITVTAPVAVIVEASGDGVLAIAVADPTRATAPIKITIDRRTTKVIAADPELTVTAGPTTTLTANLTATVGSTRTARLRLA